MTVAQRVVEIDACVRESAPRHLEPTGAVLRRGRLGQAPHRTLEHFYARLGGLRVDVAIQTLPGGGRSRPGTSPGRLVLGMTATIVARCSGLESVPSALTTTHSSDVPEHAQPAIHHGDRGATTACETATGSATGTSAGAQRR